MTQDECPLCFKALRSDFLEQHINSCLDQLELEERRKQSEEDERLALELASENVLKTSSSHHRNSPVFKVPIPTQYPSSGQAGDPYLNQKSVGSSVFAKKKANTPRETIFEKEEKSKQKAPTPVHPHNLLCEQYKGMIETELPARYQNGDWKLLYTTQQDGIGLFNFYQCLQQHSPTVLLVEDSQHSIFGAYLSEAWKKSGSKYYGGAESFLFSLVPRFSTYMWTQRNRYFMLGDGECIAVGGGGGFFGLWLDANFESGSSNTCETFDNDSLSSTPSFEVLVVEVWGVNP